MDDVLDASALAQVKLLESGHVTSEELVRGYLDRIERLDPHIHAFVTVSRRRALLDARWKDLQRRRARGQKPMPAFFGVPIGIKDLNIVRGTTTRWGSRAAMPVLLPVDDFTVAPLRRAGFVILGKLSTSEWGAMPVTEPDIHPPTRNPWSLGHSAGGSSGGSGAALAARMLPVAQGSDGAGSIRIPAAFCHLVGLKPSRGRVRNAYGINDRQLLYTSGPMAHTVDDVAAMLDVMSGSTYGRPHWAPPPARSFAELAHEPLPRLRIRYLTRTPLAPTHPEIAAGVEKVARTFAELGHEVEEGSLPDTTLEEIVPLWQHLIGAIPLTRWEKTQPITRWLAEAGHKLRGKDVSALHAALAGRYLRVLEAVDLWITPTVAQPAPTIGAYRDLPPEQAFAAAAELGGYTAVFNVTGLPAISVPLGLTQDGRPMGLQVSGRMFDEGLLLAAARQLEQLFPWNERRPPQLPS
ncbi:amidase [Pendulispora albinea]|uniref:Amidase n=1 Tax=Pendulispora albinea TaxID=2741071 RepID=A0ABZ2MCB1_9BACT